MGKLEGGAFGHVSGKIGNLVSYTLNGRNIVRKIGRQTKPRTNAQLAVWQKLKLVNHFLNPIIGFINVGFSFAAEETGKHPHNEALSYNNKNAITGEYPNLSIDYSKAMVSMGLLPPAVNPVVNKMENGVEFTWEVDANMDWNLKNDRAMLLLYFPRPDEADAIYFLSGAKRSEGRDFIELPPAKINADMQCYIAFYPDDKQSVSNSVWAGAL